MIYIPDGEPVPFTHHRVGEISIQALDQQSVVSLTPDPPIDVTSCETAGNTREWIPGPGVTICTTQPLTGTNCTVKPGEKIVWALRLPSDQVALAIQGGGRFITAMPNPTYNQPLTLAQWEERERREAEADAEYPDDW